MRNRRKREWVANLWALEACVWPWSRASTPCDIASVYHRGERARKMFGYICGNRAMATLNDGWPCTHDWRFAADNAQGVLATHAEPVPKEAPNNMCSHRRVGRSLKMVENRGLADL